MELSTNNKAEWDRRWVIASKILPGRIFYDCISSLAVFKVVATFILKQFF